MKLLIVAILMFLFSISCIFPQEPDLEQLAEQQLAEQTDYTLATFKSTRIINSHSIERMQSGNLDFRVAHRFDSFNKGVYELFGLDNSSTYFSLELGLTDWFMIGIGHATIQKYYNAFGKASILRQSSGAVTMPLSLSVAGGAACTALKKPDSDPRNELVNRMNYFIQILAARKFGELLSFQVTPTMIHRNIIESYNPNDQFAIGLAGRCRLSNRVAVTAEYFYLLRKDKDPDKNYFDTFSVGLDIDTGGHIFQIHLTNSIEMLEHGFIGATTDNWLDGGIHLGFNISRVFTIF